MNVKQLIHALEALPCDAEIVLIVNPERGPSYRSEDDIAVDYVMGGAGIRPIVLLTGATAAAIDGPPEHRKRKGRK